MNTTGRLYHLNKDITILINLARPIIVNLSLQLADGVRIERMAGIYLSFWNCLPFTTLQLWLPQNCFLSVDLVKTKLQSNSHPIPLIKHILK